MESNYQEFDSILNMAQQLQSENDFVKALDLYKKLIALNEIPKLHQTMGQIYLILGRVEEALKSFKSQLLLDPTNKEVYFFIGNCYIMLKRYAEAIKTYEKSIELDPHNPYTYDNMANAWEELNSYSQALECRKKASELKPDDAFIQCSIGNSLYKLELKEQAMEIYNNAASLDPNCPEVYYHMGNCQCSMEDYKHAIKSYLKAIALNPNFIDALNNMGNAHFDIGSLDDTITYYQKAKELDPENPDVLNNLGDLYSILGEKDNAIKCYRSILENYNDELLENLIKKKVERCPVHPLGYVNQRQKHYKKYLGDFSRVMHTIAEEKRPFIDIYEIPPQKGRYYWTYITGGMSDISQTVSDETSSSINPFTELVIYTNQKSIWARKVLYNVAYFPFLNSTNIQYGNTVKFDYPFTEESEMKNVLILDTKGEERNFLDFKLDTNKVSFLRILPISESELKYKNRYGTSSLLNKFAEAQLDFVSNITRKPIV